MDGQSPKPLVGLVVGDPAGIGPELAARLAADSVGGRRGPATDRWRPPDFRSWRRDCRNAHCRYAHPRGRTPSRLSRTTFLSRSSQHRSSHRRNGASGGARRGVGPGQLPQGVGPGRGAAGRRRLLHAVQQERDAQILFQLRGRGVVFSRASRFAGHGHRRIQHPAPPVERPRHLACSALASCFPFDGSSDPQSNRPDGSRDAHSGPRSLAGSRSPVSTPTRATKGILVARRST